MKKRIVILGGGTGGTLLANRLHRHYRRHSVDHQGVDIVVVDQDAHHLYQPALLFVPFGLTHRQEIVRPRGEQLAHGIEFVESAIDHVDIHSDTVYLENGRELAYDVLVVATGATLAFDETKGLTGAGWNETVFTFYDLAGATALEGALPGVDGGRVVVNIVDTPIKSPAAPLEFCFLADWYFTQRGIRDSVRLSYVTPLEAAFATPAAAARLGEMLDEKGIELVTGFNTGEVDGEGGRLIGSDGTEVPFDLAVVVPAHRGAAYVTRSDGLGDARCFVPTDRRTLQSLVKPNIFAIGDATDTPTSKVGSVTHFEGEVLTDNIVCFLEHRELEARYDGHASCFIEAGFEKALLLDFNYDTEPLPGRFPSAVGMPLLAESRLNHLGKLMFQWFYWHALLPGRDIPGIGATMPLAGKHRHEREHV